MCTYSQSCIHLISRLLYLLIVMEVFQLRTNLIFHVEADGVLWIFYQRAKLLLPLLVSTVDSYKEVWVYAMPVLLDNSQSDRLLRFKRTIVMKYASQSLLITRNCRQSLINSTKFWIVWHKIILISCNETKNLFRIFVKKLISLLVNVCSVWNTEIIMNYLQSSPIIVPKLCYSHPKRQVCFQIIDARFEKGIVNYRLSCFVQVIATSDIFI